MELEVVRAEIAKLELKEGDILAIKLSRQIPPEQMKQITQVIENIIPNGVKVFGYPASDIELLVVKEQG